MRLAANRCKLKLPVGFQLSSLQTFLLLLSNIISSSHYNGEPRIEPQCPSTTVPFFALGDLFPQQCGNGIVCPADFLCTSSANVRGKFVCCAHGADAMFSRDNMTVVFTTKSSANSHINRHGFGPIIEPAHSHIGLYAIPGLPPYPQVRALPMPSMTPQPPAAMPNGPLQYTRGNSDNNMARIRRLVFPNNVRPTSPVSPGILIGDILFISAQTGRDENGQYVTTDFLSFCRQAMANVGNVLRAAGISFGNVIKTNVYLKDIAYIPTFEKCYRDYFPNYFPARTIHQVAALTDQMFNYMEIDAIAVVGVLADGTDLVGPRSTRFKSRTPTLNTIYARGLL